MAMTSSGDCQLDDEQLEAVLKTLPSQVSLRQALLVNVPPLCPACAHARTPGPNTQCVPVALYHAGTAMQP